MREIAIIGGGAAGLAAAIAAAESACSAREDWARDTACGVVGGVAGGAREKENGRTCENTHVTVYEASDRIGRPILASGNGRCNFSNANIDAALYYNAEFASVALAAFENVSRETFVLNNPLNRYFLADDSSCDVSCETLAAGTAEVRGLSDLVAPNGVVQFFAQHGLIWREEGEGRLYPQANKSSVVLDILRAVLTAYDVNVCTQAGVSRIELPKSPDKPFALRMQNGEFKRADAVVLACGGAVLREMMPEQFAYTEPRPVLGPMAVAPQSACFTRQLDNIRVKCSLELREPTGSDAGVGAGDCRCGYGRTIVREVGEVLFRKYGVSGIAAFNLSRMAQLGHIINVDLFPHVSTDQLTDAFAARLPMLQTVFQRDITCAEFLRGAVLPQVAHVLLKYAEIDEDEACTPQLASDIAHACKNFQLEYSGVGDAAQCQVHRGGFAVEGFDPSTMQAFGVPGLFAAGEALDVDGPCGGYNLHWAFATGILAGVSAVASVAASGEMDDAAALSTSGQQ